MNEFKIKSLDDSEILYQQIIKNFPKTALVLQEYFLEELNSFLLTAIKVRTKEIEPIFIDFLQRRKSGRKLFDTYLSNNFRLELEKYKMNLFYKKNQFIAYKALDVDSINWSKIQADSDTLNLISYPNLRFFNYRWAPPIRLYSFTFHMLLAKSKTDILTLKYSEKTKSVEEIITDKFSKIILQTFTKRLEIAIGVEQIIAMVDTKGEASSKVKELILKRIKLLCETGWLFLCAS